MPPRSPRAADLSTALLLAVAGLILQGLLIANPGYFSHDELQWAARAVDGAAAGWTDTAALQWRPLTFELWMGLSRALFETPPLFHLAFAVLGTVNALLLWSLLRRAGAAPRIAAVAALVFLGSPCAMYVHGWVATLADVIWVACALGIGHAALRAPLAVTALATLLLTAAALLAKEAALSIPALAMVLAVLDRERGRTWRLVAAVSGAVAIAYLAVRLPALSAPRAGDPYAWSLAHVPRRWLEYQLYLAHPRVFEVHNVLDRRGLAVAAALAWLAATVAVGRHGLRMLAGWLLGGAAALGPVLVLGQSATQYGYGFAAWCAGLLALAWPGLGRAARIAVGVFAALVLVHGLAVSRQMHRVGQVQARFADAVLPVLAGSPGPVRLSPHPEADAWIFQRVTHAVPVYRGQPFSPRIRLVEAGAPADYRILEDGRLEPAD